MKNFKFSIIFILLYNMASFAQVANGVGTLPKGFPIRTDSTVNMSLTDYRDRIFGALDLSTTTIPSGCLMEYSLFCSIDFSL